MLGAVQRGGEVRLRVAPDARGKTIKGFLTDVVSPDAEAIYTDENQSYVGIGDANTVHGTVNHYRDEWVNGEIHTNTIESVWSLFQRAVIGSYHTVSLKHLPAYLDEVEWRFNGRDNPWLFRDTLLVLLHGDALPYRKLVHGVAASG